MNKNKYKKPPNITNTVLVKCMLMELSLIVCVRTTGIVVIGFAVSIYNILG